MTIAMNPAKEKQNYEQQNSNSSSNAGASNPSNNYSSNSASNNHSGSYTNYDEWKASLEARGLYTTSTGDQEADFAVYGNALSEDLKQEILDSYGQEGDLELQQKIASFFSAAGTHYIDAQTFQRYCASNGIKYEASAVSTTYIVDNKKGGIYRNNTEHATAGAITVFTLTDPKTGAQIKIADTNGNGAIETEEVFMNEILSGVTSDLVADITVDKPAPGSGHNNASENLFGASGTDGAELTEEELAEIDKQGGKQVISESEFVSLVQQYMTAESSGNTSGSDMESTKDQVIETLSQFYSVEGITDLSSIDIPIPKK